MRSSPTQWVNIERPDHHMVQTDRSLYVEGRWFRRQAKAVGAIHPRRHRDPQDHRSVDRHPFT